MPRTQPLGIRLRTAVRWPGGIGLTAWRYLWSTTPVHRWDLAGTPELDTPPPLPTDVETHEIQPASAGVGTLYHRTFRTRIRGSLLSPEALADRMREDLDQVAPSAFATFQKLVGDPDTFAVGDEFVVRMPGPWDGPVRVVAVRPASFRLATLDGHLEAGQVEFRFAHVDGVVEVVIEAWARSGDAFSHVLYTHVGLSKEVQLIMWTSVLRNIVALSGGSMEGGVVVVTRHLERDPLETSEGGSARRTKRLRRHLDDLAGRPVNFDVAADVERTPRTGWRHDEMVQRLPAEASGPPVPEGSWELARELMTAYQVADPQTVRAVYDRSAELAGRTMLLQIRFLVFRFHVGVRVGDVYDEERAVDGEPVRVFGWDYRTLEGHFESGEMHYEVWKWQDSGRVVFRLHAFSQPAHSGPLALRLGFRILGRRQQLGFYREACRRMRRLTESELETRRLQVVAAASQA